MVSPDIDFDSYANADSRCAAARKRAKFSRDDFHAQVLREPTRRDH